MTHQENILQRIKEIILQSDSAAKIYLYGSRARGTAESYADWDILVLLNRDKITFEVERNVTYPLYDLEFEIGEVISPVVYSENDWNSKHSITPFYFNVMRDGKLL